MAGGRKKEFDEETALKAAMEVFWQKGFTGTSLSDLTQRMGINKPSMYNTFGNKEELFVKATNFYIENKAKSHSKFLLETRNPLKMRLKNYMRSIISIQCESEQHKGCYLVHCQSEVAGGDLPENARNLLVEADKYDKSLLTDIFNNDPEAKERGLNKNAEMNALCLAATLRGTASMARAGATLPELEFVIDHSLKGIGL